MKTEFIPYEQALELKQLGFDEPCFAFYDESLYFPNNKNQYGTFCNQPLDASSCTAPTYSQAFRWFREKYNLDSYLKPEIVKKVRTYDYYIWIDNNEDLEIGVYKLSTYEEAELECLVKLIDIVKKQNLKN